MGAGVAGMAMLAGGVVAGMAPWVGSAGETTLGGAAAAGELLAGGVLSWGAAEMTALFPGSPATHHQDQALLSRLLALDVTWLHLYVSYRAFLLFYFIFQVCMKEIKSIKGSLTLLRLSMDE